MSDSTDLIPLRCSAEDLRGLLFVTRNPYEDLMAFKDKCFDNPEDFIQEVKRVIHFIKNDARPLDHQYFYSRTNTSFAFVYQKIDYLYRQKSIELQSKDLDETKEKEIKSLLRDLLKCKLEIEKIAEVVDAVYDGYNPILYEQLENLFDDCELLDLLLLVLSKKLKSDDMTEPLKTKGLYFISPFLKLFYGSRGDIMDFWRNPQDFLKKLNAAEEVQSEIEKLLSQYTDLNKNEISRFGKEIKFPSGPRQIVTKEKHRFKEEKGYYELLGNLSLLLCLWKQEIAGSEVFLPLVRIGLVGYMSILDGWNTKELIKKAQLDRYLKLNSLNLKDKVDLPIHFLRDLSKRDLNEVDLKLLELSFSALCSLMRFQKTSSGSPYFLERLEEYIDDCLLISEGSKSFLMHEVYEFLDSKILTLNEMQSSYLIASSVTENLISEWLPFFENIWTWNFAGAHLKRTFEYKEKYFSSLKTLLQDLMEFITLEEHAFMTLPEHLQANFIHACSTLSLDDRLFAKSDLERIFFDAQDIGIAFLRGLRYEKALFRFKALMNVVKVLGAKNGGVPFGDESQAADFIKKIYESKLIEEFIVVYEENKSFLQTVGDLNVTEAVWELFDFLAKFSLKDASFLAKERNLNFLKCILQDSCEIDPRAVDRQCYEAFLSGIEGLSTKIAFAGHLKEEKLFFRILRLYVFRPFLNSWHDEQFQENLYNALIQKETFLRLFGKFLEVFENKMRNPSLDLYDALKQFENAIGKENSQHETQQSYLAEKEAPIINEKISFDSLRNFAGGFCKRVAPFVGRMPYAFESDLNEQVGVLTKRLGRMIVDPLLVFACNQNFLRTLRDAFDDMCYSGNKEVLISAFEGVFAGTIDICKEFKLNEYSVISKLDAKRLSKMVTKIARIHYLRKEDIPIDITYQEAALMSLLIGLVNFNRYLSGNDDTSCKEIERVGDQLKEATELIDQVKNNILKCFSLETVKESRDVQALAKDCKIIFEGSNFYLNLWTDIFNIFYCREALKTSTKEIYKTILKRFDLCYETPNGQNEKLVLEGIVYNTLRLKEMSLALHHVDQDLFAEMITSPEGLEVMLKLELYLLECANYYCDSKTKDLVVTLADILEACFNRSNPSRQINHFEKDGKALLEVIINFLKKLAESQIQRNCKKLLKKNLPAVFVFIRAVYQNYATYMKEKVALEKLEEEKAILIEDYRKEIQRYIDAVVQCQHHNLGNLKELFVFGEEFNGAVPHDYWIKLSEQLSEDLGLYVRNLLQGISDNEIKDFSKYKTVNQIYQLDFKYQRLEQSFMKEVINKLSLDKDLIESLLDATKQTLQSLVLEDLNLFAKEKECLDFPEILAGFISSISKLAINYIVSCTLKNETDNILALCVDLVESVLDAQKSILSGLRRDMFSGSKSCYQSLVYLINTILRANKVLRVGFINRGMLGRILTVERLSGFKSDEITSVLFLMATILEDSLGLDSQVQLALKSVMKAKKGSEISLRDLMEDTNFKPLQNYRQVLEKLKLYGIKPDCSLELSDLGKDEDFIEKLSPVAKECIQILLKSLVESYSFEKESIASFAKVQEQQESGQRKQLSKRGILPRGYLLVDQKVEQEDETFDKPNVYLNEDLSRQMIVKDTSALVVILSGVLSSYPHLIPSVIFQEHPVEEILRNNDSDLIGSFKSDSRYSVFDVLLRLMLLEDGNSAVFLVANILDCEEAQGNAVETLNSVLMRRNIAMIIGFISNKVNEFTYKEEVLQLVMQITQKLLYNPQMIAYSMQMYKPNYSMIRIVSDTMIQSTLNSMSREEVAKNYANILRVLKTREPHEPKLFPTNFKDIFEKNLLVKRESHKKISYEDQKKFEMWEERSQWEKEETKRLLEITGLKEKELLSEIKLAAGEDRNLSSVFVENGEKEVSENLKSLYKAKQGENNSKLGYLLGKLKESNVLGQCKKINIQNLGDNIDANIFLPLLKVDFSRIEEIKNDTSLNIQTKDQEKILPEEIEKQNSPLPSAQENEDKYEEIQVDKQGEKEEEEASFKYFMNPTVKSEGNLKLRVNKGLQQSKRLKEMICLEKTLKDSDQRNEEIIKELTSKMTEFDKNVVYASLGKRFEVGLSKEFRKITEGARKELLAIQQDFNEYEEANNKIAKAEDDENEEAEEYGDLDYDFKFLAAEDGEEKEEDDREDQEELAEEYDETLAALEPENNEKISRLLNSFEVDDHFIMSVLELFFCYFNPSSDNEETITNFLKDSISLNPINELKIIDTMITILYTPEFFEYHFKKQGDNYETAVGKIFNYLTQYYQEKTLTYIFFVPKTYLENFGNELLKNMKEATNFAHKVSDCHTVLDMILNLIGTPSFASNAQWILTIVERFSSLIKESKDIKFGENVSQTDSYRRVISCKKVLSLLSLIEKSITSSSLKVQEIYINFKSIPQLFAPLHNSLTNHFYQTIVKMNLVIEPHIRVLKENQEKEILTDLNVGQFELILTILFSFASVFHENLGKKSKISKKLENLLRTVTGSLFNEEEVKAFFVNIHELAELLNKIQPQDDFKKLLNLLIMICIAHYSIIIMEVHFEEKEPKSIIELRKETGGSSLSDVEQMPSLTRLVSHEDVGEHHENMASLQRSYSHYRREVNVDFGAIFANFALKQSSRTSEIVTSKVVTEIMTVFNNLLSIIIPKFPWMIDFKSKRKLFKMRFEEYVLAKNGVNPRGTRDIQVDRKNIVFSTMKEFKDCSKKDLIQYNEIEYLNEEGVDGGGLIRDFYETISKQLFDPCVGLFKLAENQISIQPNPISGLVPYDSTLMQFAGIIVAKAISEEKVMDINFTKPFLKHILRKTITIGDMEEVDADLGKNLRWILENNIEDLYLTYTHEIEVLSERRIVELKKGGSDILVDEENKNEYVKQICEYRMTKQINIFLAAHPTCPKNIEILEFGICGSKNLDKYFSKIKKFF